VHRKVPAGFGGRLRGKGPAHTRQGTSPRSPPCVHMSFAELCQLDGDSALQQAWAAEYRARWAAHRAAASVSPGDGGAWLDGAAARAVACDAMLCAVRRCWCRMGVRDPRGLAVVAVG
jgi:hypothetical protein